MCESERQADTALRVAGIRLPSSLLPTQTERLRFREMRPSDFEEVAALLKEPTMLTQHSAPPKRTNAATWISCNLENYAKYGFGWWILETHDGEFIGECGLGWLEVHGIVELAVGYQVRMADRGRGLATEAALACRDLARSTLHVQTLVAIIDPCDRVSERVACKLGMVRAAHDFIAGTPVRRVMRMRLC